MGIFPELVKSSQVTNHVILEHVSNVLGALSVDNDRMMMVTSKTLNAGILFQTDMAGCLRNS